MISACVLGGDQDIQPLKTSMSIKTVSHDCIVAAIRMQRFAGPCGLDRSFSGALAQGFARCLTQGVLARLYILCVFFV